MDVIGRLYNGVYFLGFILNAHQVVCEMRFVCPRPQTPSHVTFPDYPAVTPPVLTHTPCSLSNSSANFYANYIEVKPGPLTVHLEETVYRPESPAAISLLKYGSHDQVCILLDHIPHMNTVNITTDTSQCPLNGYPLGRCSSNSYLTINIPDIECDMCVLQYMSPEIRGRTIYPLCVVYKQGLSANCTTNYTCANIKITLRDFEYQESVPLTTIGNQFIGFFKNPTAAGKGKSLEACQNYQSNLKGSWPYIMSVIYQANLGGSPFVGGFARFILNYKLNILKYHINLGNVQVLPDRDDIHIVLQQSNARMFHIPVTGQDIIGRFFAFDEIPKQYLGQGRLALELQILNTNQTIRREIRIIENTLKRYRYRPDRYIPSAESYTPSGWLTGYDFTGVNAIYPQVVQPTGPCAPRPRQYASMLSDSEGILRGLVTFGILSTDLVFLDAVIITRRRSANYISLGADDGSGENMTITAEHINRGFAHSTLNFRGRKDPNAVESKMRIGESFETLKSRPFKAFKVLITDPDDRFATLAVIQLLNTGSLGLTVAIISGTSQRTIEADVFIKGPQLSSISGSKRTLPIKRTNSPDSPGWVSETNIQIKDTFIPHCLLLGILQLEVFFPTANLTLSSQFSPETDEWLCPDVNHPACLRCIITANGEPVDRGLAEISPNAAASLYLAEDKTALEYTISVNDLRPKEFVDSITLVNGKENIGVIPSTNFTPAAFRNRTMVAQGTIRLPVENQITEPLKFVLSTNLDQTANIFGILPLTHLSETKQSSSTNTGNRIQVFPWLAGISFMLILLFWLQDDALE